MKLLPPYTISLLLPAFHPVLDVVVLSTLTFDFLAGGEVAPKHESVVLSTGMYKTTSDSVRAAFEVLLLLWTTAQLVREARDIANTSLFEYEATAFRRPRAFLLFVLSGTFRTCSIGWTSAPSQPFFLARACTPDRYPFLQPIFHTESLTLNEFILVVAASSIVFFAVEIEKLVSRKRRGSISKATFV